MADAIFPVIPTDIPAQAAETIGRVPAFVWSENGRGGAFQLVDGALVERTGREAVRQWFELMLRQKPGAIPIYRTDSSSQPGVDRTMLDRRMPEGWVQAEIERQVRETAAFCPAVRAVDSFVFTRLRRGLQVEFTAHLHTDETVEVSTYVNGE